MEILRCSRKTIKNSSLGKWKTYKGNQIKMDEFIYKAGNFTCSFLEKSGGSKLADEIGCSTYQPIVGLKFDTYDNAINNVYGAPTNEVYWIGILTVIIGFICAMGILNFILKLYNGD